MKELGIRGDHSSYRDDYFHCIFVESLVHLLSGKFGSFTAGITEEDAFRPLHPAKET